jgi:hypothetical protein
VDCNEAQQFAGDAIDRSLADGLAKEFEAHLKACKPCRREVALETLSKHMVRQNLRPVQTPRVVQSEILSSLRLEYSRQEPERGAWLSRWNRWRVAVPAVAGGIVAIVFFLMVSSRTDPSYRMTAHTASNDIIHLSFENFAMVQAGKMRPTMVTFAPESVGDFLQRSNLQFGVHVPRWDHCDWCGGSASECSGVKQAHLLFKMGGELVYVFEVSDDDALYGTRVSLPLAAKRALAQSGWYTDPDHPDCNVILWKTDEAVCVAVSTMKKGQLLALLSMR